MKYEHTQIGYLMICVLIGAALLFSLVFSKADFDLIFVLFPIFFLMIIGSFMTLNVAIDENYLWIKFGYGIYRKRFSLKEIASAKAVRNSWWYGWGIRLWLFPPMWIYNVSGLDAVEIKMKNGKIYRIGTDEPGKLEIAINKELLV